MPLDSTLPSSNQTVELEVLRCVRAAIVKRGAWCQGTLRTGSAFCAVGWLKHFTEPYGSDYSWNKCDQIIELSMSSLLDLEQKDRLFWQKRPPHKVLTDYNDHVRCTQADIVALFDAAIATMEARNAV